MDNLIVTDIYAASEKPIATVTAERFVQELKKRNPNYALFYVPYDVDFNALKKQLDLLIAPDDLVLLQGAGKINKLVKKLKNDCI